jgi:hypothetical protein
MKHTRWTLTKTRFSGILRAVPSASESQLAYKEFVMLRVWKASRHVTFCEGGLLFYTVVAIVAVFIGKSIFL